MTAGLLLVLMEPPAPLEDEFNDWYDTEDLPQRRGLPGIESGARWACVDGFPRWMALYDLRSLDALTTPEYLAVSGPNSTPWSRRVLPRTIGRSRIVAQALPGNAPLQLASADVASLLLARYPVGGDTSAFVDLRSRLESTGAVQTRGFVESGNALWVTVAFAHPVGSDTLRTCAARCGSVGATIFNVYRPYHRD